MRLATKLSKNSVANYYITIVLRPPMTLFPSTHTVRVAVEQQFKVLFFDTHGGFIR